MSSAATWSKKVQIRRIRILPIVPVLVRQIWKIELFLESIMATLKEPTESRLIQHLLSNPVQDGGQWDMLVNLIEKGKGIFILEIYTKFIIFYIHL